MGPGARGRLSAGVAPPRTRAGHGSAVRRDRRRDGATPDPGPGCDHRRAECRVHPPRRQVRLHPGAVVPRRPTAPRAGATCGGPATKGGDNAAHARPRPARRLRHPRRPRRRRARRARGRRQPADLPDLDVRAGRRRASPSRLRVRPHAEPHPGAAGAGRGRARGRGLRHRVRLGIGGDCHPGRAGRPRRGDRRRRRRLRRDVPLLRAGGAAAGRGRPLRGPRGGPRASPGGRAVAADSPGLVRDAVQPLAEGDRHRRRRARGRRARGRARGAAARRHRQHVRLAGAPAAARAGRGRHLPFGDQVPRWPQRHGQRRCRDVGCGRGRAASLPPERDGRGAGTAGLLPRAARAAHAGPARGAPQRQRAGGRPGAGGP